MGKRGENGWMRTVYWETMSHICIVSSLLDLIKSFDEHFVWHLSPNMYLCNCLMSRNSWPIIYSNLLYKLGQDFFDSQYALCSSSVTSINFRWSVRQREHKNKGDICVWTVWIPRGLSATNTSILLLQVLAFKYDFVIFCLYFTFYLSFYSYFFFCLQLYFFSRKFNNNKNT